MDGTLNAVALETDLAKEITVIGQGAGPIETASTLVNDLIDIIKVREKQSRIHLTRFPHFSCSPSNFITASRYT